VTTTIKGQPTSEQVRADLATQGRPVLLSFSRGKDSIAAWLALRAAGIQVHSFYLYSVPGLLAFERDSLAYFEDVFGQQIYRYPHPSLHRQLRHLVFQPPERLPVLRAARIPHLTHEKVNAAVRADLGLAPDTWVADGVRAADSIVRRAALATHGVFRSRVMKTSPVWDWYKAETLTTIRRVGIQLPVDYRWFGRSFDGIDYRFLEPLSRHAPDDYQRILEWFPLADLELFRRARRS
jgi:hypothetical protein